MRLASRERHALTAMLYLAAHHEMGTDVPLAELERGQELSKSYLEQLFGKLRRAKLVTEVRGLRGCYRLARTPKEITVADVLDAVDPSWSSPADTSCTGVHWEQFWRDLSARLYAFLDMITLAEVLDRVRNDGIAERSEHETSREQADDAPLNSYTRKR